MFPFPTNLFEFAIWLASSAAAGIIVSEVLEKNEWFKKWESKYKALVVVLVFVALPYLSELLLYILNTADPAVIDMVQKQLLIGLGGLAAWATSQWYHAKSK